MSNTSLVANLSMSGSEVLTAAEAPSGATAAARTIAITGSDISVTLDSTTTPKIEVPPVVRKVTIAGTITIDFTAAQGVALPAAATRTIDQTGKKLVAVRLSCPTTNVAVINVAPGASNPYPLFGTANDIDVKAGQTLIAIMNGIASPYGAVSATVKTLDISGTNGDVINCEFYFGT